MTAQTEIKELEAVKKHLVKAHTRLLNKNLSGVNLYELYQMIAGLKTHIEILKQEL